MQVKMSHTPRQSKPILNRNKNETTTFDFLKPSTLIPNNNNKLPKPFIPRATTAPPRFHKPSRPPADNKLMAGYLAHEFLTQGTLFGQPWDPARAEAVPVSAAAHSTGFRKPAKQISKPAEPKPGEKRKYERYEQVSGVLMGKNGTHIPGIVNPTQLTRYLNPQ